MKRSSLRSAAAGLLAAAALAGCAAAAAAPDPAPAPQPTATAGAAPGARPHTEADVRFLQGMIAHHGQALEMTALVPERTRSEGLRLMAERIEVSQRDEIAAMRRWLERRGAAAPAADAHAGHHSGGGHAQMPGMLTPEEMGRLRAAAGPAFERLFLELMIRHHEGALVMVRELLSSPGAGEDPEVFQLAADVDADQRMEIARMRRMLDALPPAGR